MRPERHLWMAPALQEIIRRSGALVGCSLLFGLLMQPLETAGPDGVGEQGPNLKFRLLRLGRSTGCPCFRPDRFRHHIASLSQPHGAG
jgi:hypothetical protein